MQNEEFSTAVLSKMVLSAFVYMSVCLHKLKIKDKYQLKNADRAVPLRTAGFCMKKNCLSHENYFTALPVFFGATSNVVIKNYLIVKTVGKSSTFQSLCLKNRLFFMYVKASLSAFKIMTAKRPFHL